MIRSGIPSYPGFVWVESVMSRIFFFLGKEPRRSALSWALVEVRKVGMDERVYRRFEKFS